MNVPYFIRMLGGLCVTQGGRAIDRFYTRKAGALLAFLAYYPDRRHAREDLAERLWPDADLDSGRLSLRVALNSLRRQLEPPGVLPGTVLQADRTTIGFRPSAISTDIAAFQAALERAGALDAPSDRLPCLREAVDLYRGPLLAGYAEPWILTEQHRLAGQYFRALRELTALLEAQGDPAHALEYAVRAVHEMPAHEAAQGDVLRLTAALGQAADAMGRLKTHRLTSRSDSAALASNSSAPSVSPEPALETDAPLPALRLPLHLTRFFGREKEVATLRGLLVSPDTRLVTLTGSGGVGKTRLAVEAARLLAAEYGGAVWFASLADLHNSGTVDDLLADSMRLERSVSEPALDHVLHVLRMRKSLLVLDNVEQRIAEATSVLLRLLHAAPELTCLVTSRRRLELAGERDIPVLPLPVPAPGSTPERLLEYAGVQLFVDRSQAVRPDFQITAGNAAATAALSAKLEGIPLAIELAAAWATVMTPAQMLDKMQSRFEFLVSRRTRSGAQPRTLRAAIEWSYHQLAPEQQRFFAALSLFYGWNTEAATVVCAEPSAQMFLGQLRAYSLILSEAGDHEMRFHMLETLKEFGREQLTGEARIEVERRFAAHFRTLIEQAAVRVGSSDQPDWMERLASEEENVKCALDWWLKHDAEVGLALVLAMRTFWLHRKQFRESLEYHEEALRLTGGATSLRADAFLYAGELAHWQGEYARGEAHFIACIALREALHDDCGIARALFKLGNLLSERGEPARALVVCERSVALFRNFGDRASLGEALFMLGNVFYDMADYSAARASFVEALPLANDNLSGLLLVCLGNIAWKQGDTVAARRYHVEHLRSCALPARLTGPPYSLETLAALLAAEGRAADAARLFAASARYRLDIHYPVPPCGRADYDKTAEQIRAALGAEAHAAAWAEGHAMPVEEAIAYALACAAA